MFIQPKTHWNIKKNYYSNGNQLKRKLCKGSLETFLSVMQIRNFLTDLCCILAVFRYKYLNIAATWGTHCTLRMFCYHKRSFNGKEKLLSFIFLEILEKIAGMTKINP